ncbi:MAG: phosphotransferase [Pseudoxanthomonas sp.]
MSVRAELPNQISPTVAKAYLANVADALAQTLIPKLDGPTRTRAVDCLRIVSRLITDTEVSDGVQAILAERRSYTASQLRTSIDAYAANIAALGGERLALLDEVIGWLSRSADEVATLPRVLIHGDLGFHSLLLDGNELVSILDWEIAHLGSPACDLGYLLHAVRDDLQWGRFMAHYHAAGGIDVPQFHVDYHALFIGIWFHQIQLQARAALCAGAVRSVEIAAICADFSAGLLADVARAFGRISNDAGR